MNLSKKIVSVAIAVAMLVSMFAVVATVTSSADTTETSVWNGKITLVQMRGLDANKYAKVTKNEDGSVNIKCDSTLDADGVAYFYGAGSTNTCIRNQFYQFQIHTADLDKAKIAAAGNKVKIAFTVNDCLNANDLGKKDSGYFKTIGIGSNCGDDYNKVNIGQTYVGEVDMSECQYNRDYAAFIFQNYGGVISGADVTIKVYVEEEKNTSEPTTENSGSKLISDKDFLDRPFDENKFNVKISDIIGYAGQTVDVTVTINNNPGINCGAITLRYDPKVINPILNSEALVAGSSGVFVSGGEFLAGMVRDYIVNPKAPAQDQVTDGTKIIKLTYASNDLTMNTNKNGALAKLRFMIADDAKIGTESALVYADYNSPFIDCDGEDVEATFADAKVVVTEKPTEEISNELVSDKEYLDRAYDKNKFNVKINDVKGYAGQTVDVTVTINNNPGINGGGISFRYDPNIMTPLLDSSDCVICSSDVFSNGGEAWSGPVSDYIINPTAPGVEQQTDGTECFNFSFAYNKITKNNKNNGVLARFKFKIAEDAKIGTESAFVYTDYDTPFINSEGDDVEATFADAKVVVTEKTQDNTTKPVLLGDANSDGKINMKDVLLTRKYIAGWNVIIDKTAADVDASGKVNMKDVLLMRKYIAGKIKNFNNV